MFPVEILLTVVEEGSSHEAIVADLQAQYKGWVTASTHTGPGTFIKLVAAPKTPRELGIILEYAEDCHHGFCLTVVRSPEKSHYTANTLSLSSVGLELDGLPPPTMYALAANTDEHDFSWQARMVEDWSETSAYIDYLEREIKILRGR